MTFNSNNRLEKIPDMLRSDLSGFNHPALTKLSKLLKDGFPVIKVLRRIIEIDLGFMRFY